MEQAEEQQPQQLESTPTKITIPPLPVWPTSKPGPRTTEPPPGMKRMHIRTEQVLEVGYDQERGEPGTLAPERSLPDASLKDKTAFDQLETAPKAERRKKR